MKNGCCSLVIASRQKVVVGERRGPTLYASERGRRNVGRLVHRVHKSGEALLLALLLALVLVLVQ